MKLIESMKEVGNKVKLKIENLFDSEELKQLGKEVGFLKRSTGKIEGKDFITLMTFGFLENSLESLEGLCDILHELNPNTKISAQALGQRINKSESVQYLKEVFNLALKANLESIASRVPIDLLAPFNKAYIEDSSKSELNQNLAVKYPGSGGNASNSSLKVNLIYELKEKIVYEASISSGTKPDQSEKGMFDHIKENDLVIRDLGYFSTGSFSKIIEKLAYYLSRFKKGVNVYLSDQEDSCAINLAEYIDKNYSEQSVIDLDVYMSVQKLAVRLIAYRLPEKTVNERRRKAKKNAKKKGRTPSEEYLKWLSFSFFITNVARKIWAPKIIGTIYRVRWEIELIFKNWKSLLKIQILKGTRSERIECILYGRLITIIIMTMLYSYVSWYSEKWLSNGVLITYPLQ